MLENSKKFYSMVHIRGPLGQLHRSDRTRPIAASLPSLQEEKLQSSVAPAQQYATKAISDVSRDNTMYGSSYSGVSFASSFDPDNVAVDRHPQYSG